MKKKIPSPGRDSNLRPPDYEADQLSFDGKRFIVLPLKFSALSSPLEPFILVVILSFSTCDYTGPSYCLLGTYFEG